MTAFPAKTTPYLYLLLPSDLDPASGIEQMTTYACQAATSFVHKTLGLPNDIGDIVPGNGNLYNLWCRKAAEEGEVGYGHVGVQSVPLATIQRMVQFARTRDIRAGITVDPTYPYIVPDRHAALIDPAKHTGEPIQIGGGNTLLLRSEATAGYIIGFVTEVMEVLDVLKQEGIPLSATIRSLVADDKSPNSVVMAVLVRSDLPSLNPGKAVAHAAHAANQAVHNLLDLNNPVWGLQHMPDLQAWVNSTPSGFGTTLTLDARNLSLPLLTAALEGLAGVYAGIIEDEKFPWKTSAELGPLIRNELHTQDPDLSATSWTCYRYAVTCAWAFGDKERMKVVLGQFGLHP